MTDERYDPNHPLRRTARDADNRGPAPELAQLHADVAGAAAQAEALATALRELARRLDGKA